MNKSFLAAFALSVLLQACSLQPAVDSASSIDWPNYGRDYSNNRFSPLSRINRDNVAQLVPAWSYRSGVKATFQSTPIVVDGVMYVSLPFNHVVALDARTGKELWRYEHKRRAEWKMCCGPGNRGVAVSGGKVYIGTVDARLVALDAKSGRMVWDIDTVSEDVRSEGTDDLHADDPFSREKVSGGTGIGIAMAPVVYDGKVIVGITGVGYGLHIDSPREDAPLGAVIGVSGRYGRPGFLAAFDADTGKRVWQFDTIPPQGWEGEFTPVTPDGVSLNRDIAKEKATFTQHADAWRYGGGSAWTTPAIDPKLGLLYRQSFAADG